MAKTKLNNQETISENILKLNDKNFVNAHNFLKKQHQILDAKISDKELDNPSSHDAIKNIVINPDSFERPELLNLKHEKLHFDTYKKQLKAVEFLTDVPNKKRTIPGIETNKKQAKTKPVIKLNNYHIGKNILEQHFKELIRKKKVKKALIISDSAYTRHLNIYKRAVNVLQAEDIDFVEFTNIQPVLERNLIFKIADFAYKHNVNSLIVIGSDSLIDISKLLLVKLLKPNVIRLHKNQRKPIISTHFSIISIPTMVVPDIKINSKSCLDNTIMFKKYDYFGNTIFLSHPIDNSDAVFYCTDLFKELLPEKIIEILHETFFRLILNFYDEKSVPAERDEIIKKIRVINWYTQFVYSKQKLNDEDEKIILDIVASTVDGRNFIDNGMIWTWYKLESSLSHLVNSKKCEGLALFLPSFLEFSSNEDSAFKDRSEELATKLYNLVSVDGLIFSLIKYIEKYKLPTKLLQIKQIEKIDYKFLSYLVRKSSNYISSFKITKTIIKNLSVF